MSLDLRIARSFGFTALLPPTRLSSITNANNQTQVSYSYDSADRVQTYTDSEGYPLFLSARSDLAQLAISEFTEHHQMRF